MNRFCPNCEEETDQEFIKNSQVITVRGESIPVAAEYFLCKRCNGEYEEPREGFDPLDQAYREFRRRKGMLQPEEIKDQRKRLALTQKEFSIILGIGIATLNRYENGSLQSESHDQTIRFAMDADHLREMINNKRNKLPPETIERLINQPGLQDPGWPELVHNAVKVYGSYAPDLYSGYKRFDLAKLVEVVKFFCYKNGVVENRLVKLLFHADFSHFKLFNTSITGLRYIHTQRGPEPEHFETWRVALTDWMKVIRNDFVADTKHYKVHFRNQVPDISLLDMTEIQVLSQAANKFQFSNAAMISEDMPAGEGYNAGNKGELISYACANEMAEL